MTFIILFTCNFTIYYIINLIYKNLQNLPGFETGFGGAGRPGVFTVAAIAVSIIITV